ncbi:DUF1772 domain-containing protein [Streptomyces sp. AJS327]|uniref:DUF1772 domain-containing protein n=1 Tax=Streptomyces sp. AJS327 TaxID=2545265 RepID=UPI0015E012EB|nr:DUF1772 domain-containing protein [Streptomyces sp. AJS327]MBA0053776.1 DUF1772 domain-containing protein [Streptomyces sp. AJS327]
MRVRITQGIALLSTGALSGAFGYGAANLVPTFNVVPLDTRLYFHSELMRMNSITMQATMAMSFLSCVTLAVLTRGTTRRLAGGAGLLALASFLITRFGNVPINGRIKKWVTSTPPPDHAEILNRWEAFNYGRTATAFLAFGLLIYLTLRTRARDTETGERATPIPVPNANAPERGAGSAAPEGNASAPRRTDSPGRTETAGPEDGRRAHDEHGGRNERNVSAGRGERAHRTGD